MTAGLGAWILAVFVDDLSKPKADFGLLIVQLLVFLPLCLASAWQSWKDYQARRKIDEAGKTAAVLAGAVDSTPRPPDDHGYGPAARAPTARQPPAAVDPVAGAVRIRCPECGADGTEATQVCARCGAPLWPVIRPEQ